MAVLTAIAAAMLGGRTGARVLDDLEARSDMLQAATFAGMGFGNAGVHVPHASGYPIAGMARHYRPAGYPVAEPLAPHGQSVAVTAPAALRYTFSAAPERHLRAAALLAVAPARSSPTTSPRFSTIRSRTGERAPIYGAPPEIAAISTAATDHSAPVL
jgi:alcohol dehydrogenase class IV